VITNFYQVIIVDAPKLKALIVYENKEYDRKINQQTIDFVRHNYQSKVVAPLNDFLALIFLLQNMLSPRYDVIVYFVLELLRIGHSADILVNI